MKVVLRKDNEVYIDGTRSGIFLCKLEGSKVWDVVVQGSNHEKWLMSANTKKQAWRVVKTLLYIGGLHIMKKQADTALAELDQE